MREENKCNKDKNIYIKMYVKLEQKLKNSFTFSISCLANCQRDCSDNLSIWPLVFVRLLSESFVYGTRDPDGHSPNAPKQNKTNNSKQQQNRHTQQQQTQKPNEMGALSSRQNADVEETDITANHAYRYPPKSGECFFFSGVLQKEGEGGV